MPGWPVQLPVYPWGPEHPIVVPPPTEPVPQPPGSAGQLPGSDPGGSGWVWGYVPGYGWMWAYVPGGQPPTEGGGSGEAEPK
jgi:hypothetical protein